MASKAIGLDNSEDADVFYDVIDAMFKKLDPPMFENYTGKINHQNDYITMIEHLLLEQLNKFYSKDIKWKFLKR